ncbi:MAG: PqqD family protein [Actinomycetota bacterium]
MTASAGRPTTREDLTSIELDGEIVVYDEVTGALHHLNPSASIVMSLCDGTLSIEDMALAISEVVDVPVADLIVQVRSAIERLAEAGLIH